MANNRGGRGGRQQAQRGSAGAKTSGGAKVRPGMRSSTLHGQQAGDGRASSEKRSQGRNQGRSKGQGQSKSAGVKNAAGNKCGVKPQTHGKKKNGSKVNNKGEHIVMVGFMGSGKSSVSRVLAKRTGLSLIDVDKHIEQSQGRKIKQIFAEEGEAGFRRIETQTMAALAFEPKSIISCGGGIVGSAVNRAIVKALGTVVYLEVPCEEAVGRISDPSTRPMLNGGRPVQEIYDERLPLYRDVADITINTSGKSVGQNVGQVLGALKRKGLL